MADKPRTAAPPRAARSTRPRPTVGESEPAELNLRISHSLARYLAEEKGAEVLAEVAAAAGLRPEDLDGSSRWVSHARFERLLAAARERMADDEEFRQACGHRLGEGYGVMRLQFWALSPGLVYQKAFSSFDAISAISEAAVVERGRGHVRAVYRSTRPESRLMCLSRQGQGAELPRLWGLPRAVLRETRCIAWGDDRCETEFRWQALTRLRALAAGLALGGALWAAGAWAGLVEMPVGLALLLLGGTAAHIWELRRVQRHNLARNEELQDGLREALREENGARRELLAMQQREREWSRVLEAQLAERAASMEAVVAGLRSLQERRVVELRSLSHDMKNPLAVIKGFLDLLEEDPDMVRDEGAHIVQEPLEGVRKLEALLASLLTAAQGDEARVARPLEHVESEELTATVRRRLEALCYGKDVRVTAFRTREAPGSVNVDRLALDRIVDNLLSNAAKYTDRGSIVVEVGGTPGFLTIKVSDTGRGIADDEIEHVFEPRRSDPDQRAPDSHGLGLSVVVLLLAQLGGRLEVMSKPGVGTTFWAHLPVLPRGASLRPPAANAPAELRGRVLTIRRSLA